MNKNNYRVIKIGGSVLNSDEAVERIIDCLRPRLIPGESLLVHGGGSDITYWLKRLGVKAEFIDGQRVTDSDTMKVVEMVLSGLMNKKLVNMLEEKSLRAAGVSGRDASLALADFVDERLGRVGKVSKIDPSLLISIMEGGIIPVVSPVSNASDGGAMNVNADFFAAAVAASLKAAEFNLVTDSGGVLKDGEFIRTLTCDDISELIRGGIVRDGMIPKLQASKLATAGGVKKVNILDYEGSEGTCII